MVRSCGNLRPATSDPHTNHWRHKEKQFPYHHHYHYHSRSNPLERSTFESSRCRKTLNWSKHQSQGIHNRLSHTKIVKMSVRDLLVLREARPEIQPLTTRASVIDLYALALPSCFFVGGGGGLAWFYYICIFKLVWFRVFCFVLPFDVWLMAIQMHWSE